MSWPEVKQPGSESNHGPSPVAGQLDLPTLDGRCNVFVVARVICLEPISLVSP